MGLLEGLLGSRLLSRALKMQFLKNLAPTWGASWAPKMLLFVGKFSQEAAGSDPGALLKGVETGPQHRRHSRSLFHRFWVRFGGDVGWPPNNKTLACVVPKALSAIFSEAQLQEPLGATETSILDGLGGQVGVQKFTSCLQEAS